MWPWGHLALGYLLYSLYYRFNRVRLPPGPEALLLALGTQAPDLVDKPFAWTVSILPSGRSLSHSVLIAALVLSALVILADRYDRRNLGLAFGSGYAIHLVGDALYPLFRLDFEHLTFLAWPLLPLPSYDEDHGIIEYILAADLTPEVAFETLLFAVAILAWRADGYPGLETLRSWSVRIARGVTE